MAEEFKNVQDWAASNKMVINYLKTKEIVFRKPHPTKYSLTPTYVEIELVHHVKLLGVFISENLYFERHVSATIACCSHRFYLLKLLRDGGMSVNNLNVIFCSLVINRILYCLAVWGGFLNLDQVGRIDAVLKRARRYRITKDLYCLAGLLAQADNRLFERAQNQNHCLHHLLPPLKTGYFNLRSHGHSFNLPRCRLELYRKSFFPRCLYNFL